MAVLANVTATFSEAIDPTTVSASTFELRDPSNALIPATITYNSTTNKATLDPTPSLASLTTYTAIVRGGTTDPRIKDLAGNALAANFTWSFTTLDSTAPTVTTVLPTNGATGVTAGANVTATFSEAIDPATLTSATFELRDPSSTPVAATLSFSAATRIATLDPNAPLAYSTTYTATITTGVTASAVRPVSRCRSRFASRMRFVESRPSSTYRSGSMPLAWIERPDGV